MSKHGQSSTVGSYKPGCVFLTSRDIIIAILPRDRYQATGTAKDRRRPGQPRIMTRRPDATLASFFVLRHYPFCVEIKGEETLFTNMTMPEPILPTSLTTFWKQYRILVHFIVAKFQ